MSFLLLYATQKLDGVSAFALTVYLTMIFCGAAVGCAVVIHRKKLMRLFKAFRVCTTENRQSRLEQLLTSPFVLLPFVGLAIRAVLPLFG